MSNSLGQLMGGRLFFVGEVNALDNIKAAAIQLGCVEMEEDVFVNRFDACVNCIVMAVLGIGGLSQYYDWHQ